MPNDNEDPPSMNTSPNQNGDVDNDRHETTPSKKDGVLLPLLKFFLKPKQDSTLRDAIAEYIEEDSDENEEPSISAHEKTLISNVLNLRDMSVADVMIPRADIVSIEESTTQAELLALLAERQYSRIPVYRETLDNVLGSIHVKDILATLARGENIVVKDLTRDAPIISPSMHVLDLLLQMRMTRKHMALIVDEFGGIDGLITIGDVIEAIVGEIDDEHDPEDQAEIITQTDGTIVADARVYLHEFEDQFGHLLNEEERDDSNTLGGLVFVTAGRVPARGEVITHRTGMVFEILEADPRRVNKVCIRNIPAPSEPDED